MKKKKEWLFVRYKKEHPEAVPHTPRSRLSERLFYTGIGILVFLAFNGLAAALAAAMNPNIRMCFGLSVPVYAAGIEETDDPYVEIGGETPAAPQESATTPPAPSPAPSPAPEASPPVLQKPSGKKKPEKQQPAPEPEKEEPALKEPAGTAVSENEADDRSLAKPEKPAGTAVSGNEVKSGSPAKPQKPAKPVVSGNQIKKSPAENSRADPDQPAGKHIAGTIILAYLLAAVIFAAAFAGFAAPWLYYRNDEGVYKFAGVLFLKKSKECFFIRIPVFLQKEHKNFKIVFKRFFSDRHQGEEICVGIGEEELKMSVSESIIFSGK